MDRTTPLYDTRLSDRERAEWLLSQLTLEKKFGFFTLNIRLERLGLTVHPVCRLIWFERVHNLPVGECRTVSFTVNPSELEVYMESLGKKAVESGQYMIYAGASCLDERVCIHLEL